MIEEGKIVTLGLVLTGSWDGKDHRTLTFDVNCLWCGSNTVEYHSVNTEEHKHASSVRIYFVCAVCEESSAYNFINENDYSGKLRRQQPEPSIADGHFRDQNGGV